MKLFVDAADVGEIRDAVASRIAAGVLTAAAPEMLREICALAAGPVFAAVAPGPAAQMRDRARAVAGVAENLVVAVPAGEEGLEVVRACAAEGIGIGVIGCLDPVEAVRAARAGARFVAVSADRLGGSGADGMSVVRKIVAGLRSYHFATEVLVAGASSPGEVVDAALAGAHVASAPPAVLRELARNRTADAEPARVERPADGRRIGP